MLRVIIIDDEPLVRVGLRSMIHWEEYGYKIIDEAPNGQIGLDQIIKNKPDIVITDIKMPVMDGLEMMRLVIKSGQRTKFIILSSYDEFELVKKAMKQGAEEYLIKLDLEPEILLNTMDMVREKIKIGEGNPGEERILEKDLLEKLPIFRESFFKQIIDRPVQSQTDLSEQAKYLGIELDEQLACAIIYINDLSVLKKYDSEEARLFESSVQNTVNEIINDIFKGYTFTWSQGEFVVIFSGAAEINRETFINKALDMGERLAQTLKQYFNISISVGISNPYRGYLELALAYFEACRAAQECYYLGMHTATLFEEMPKDNEDRGEIDISEQKNILPKAIELHDIEMIGAVFETMLTMVNDPSVSKEQAYDLCFQIAYLVSGAIGLNETQQKEILGHDQSVYKSIHALNTQSEIINWIIGLEQSICRMITQKDEQKNHRLIARAKKYILEHFTDGISLDQVAEAINISPGYLSTIFRQYTGICFIDYLTGIKIDEAKRLLRESDNKIYEIAEFLGYQNAYYFSKVFKKITGMTPSEFSGKSF